MHNQCNSFESNKLDMARTSRLFAVRFGFAHTGPNSLFQDPIEKNVSAVGGGF
jgi:hypothetical protein